MIHLLIAILAYAIVVLISLNAGRVLERIKIREEHAQLEAETELTTQQRIREAVARALAQQSIERCRRRLMDAVPDLHEERERRVTPWN